MSERENDATDANCEMDTEPDDGFAWGVAALVVFGALVWILAGLGVVYVVQSIGGG
jgi:hypothetical protein